MAVTLSDKSRFHGIKQDRTCHEVPQLSVPAYVSNVDRYQRWTIQMGLQARCTRLCWVPKQRILRRCPAHVTVSRASLRLVHIRPPRVLPVPVSICLYVVQSPDILLRYLNVHFLILELQWRDCGMPEDAVLGVGQNLGLTQCSDIFYDCELLFAVPVVFAFVGNLLTS